MADNSQAGDQQRSRRKAEILAALAAMYVAAKIDVLRIARLGQIRDALADRWRLRLREIVTEQATTTATMLGASTVKQLGADADVFDPARMTAYLDVFADKFSAAWYEGSLEALDSIPLSTADIEAAMAEVMDAIIAEADNDAENIVSRAGNFGILEAGRASGATTKTWHTGENPRPTHAAMNGVTIPIEERFPNGLSYPGAPGPPAEVVNCNCRLTVGKR